MVTDGERISRRAALVRVGASAAAAGTVLALGASGTARAGNGESFLLGVGNDATATTTLTMTGTHALAVHATAGDGVRSGTAGTDGSGVFGYGEGSASYGVFGYNGVNMGRAALGAPTAALWASQYAASWALKVEGRVSLSRSGRATVGAGKRTVDVVVGDLSGTPLGFATPMTYRAGVYVAAVRPNVPSAGMLRITLNKAPSKSMTIAWLVLG